MACLIRQDTNVSIERCNTFENLIGIITVVYSKLSNRNIGCSHPGKGKIFFLFQNIKNSSVADQVSCLTGKLGTIVIDDQQDATILVYLFIYLFLISSTFFGRCIRPSSGALDCIYSF